LVFRRRDFAIDEYHLPFQPPPARDTVVRLLCELVEVIEGFDREVRRLRVSLLILRERRDRRARRTRIEVELTCAIERLAPLFRIRIGVGDTPIFVGSAVFPARAFVEVSEADRK